MPRTISDDALAAMEAGNVQPVYLAKLVFTSAPIYVWSGIGNLSWDGQTWTGTGTLGSISPITQTDEVQAEAITLSLSGVPTGLVSSALDPSEQSHSYAIQVWLGFLADDGTLITDPVKCHDGYQDVFTLQDDGATVTISVTSENKLIGLQRASARRWTNDDQQIDYATDKGFQFVAAIQQWDGTWGKQGGGNGRFFQLLNFGAGQFYNVD